jgi:hypothetical protein
MPPKDRKVVAVGMIRLLTQSQYMLREPFVQAWYVTVYPTPWISANEAS